MKYIGALDQGTTSTRFIIFDERNNIISTSQMEHRQIYPRPGWVEHNPEEIWNNTCLVIESALEKAGLRGDELSGVGITNQRETVIAFDKTTGKPYHNAIVWQDLRGADFIDNKLRKSVSEDWIRKKTGLLFSPYFSGSKIRWLLDNVPAVKRAEEKGSLLFGTIDTYMTYKLTGGKAMVTDVTNASRYMLMNIEEEKWDKELLEIFGVKESSLPEIVSSSGVIYGYTDPDGPFGAAIPVCGILGDQQAALFGQACFDKGNSKCTYGTGCFMLLNIGEDVCYSSHGLITTIGYRIQGEKTVYALEGSVAVAGSLVQWVRDNLKMVTSAKELDELAMSVQDCGGVYIVPAFAGLFAPYWRSDARGVIAGLTGYASREHICRAVLEATAFQAYDIASAMESDSSVEIESLKVDGGMTNSWPLMAFQSDILSKPVIRPVIVETTALGAAYAAGLTVGVWKDKEELRSYWKEQTRWTPTMDDKERQKKVGFWKKAVSRTLDWVVAEGE